MNNLESYQLHKKVIRAKTINPIFPKEPNYYYQIDLIDMSKYYQQNKGFKWIFTIIDLFTKKAYAIPLLNKEGKTVAEALTNWINTLPKPPHIIQSDHGSEFINKNMKQVLKLNNIRHQVSLSHQPESQGSIERINGTLKRMIMSYFTTNNNNIWYNILDDLLYNYNNSKYSLIKIT